MIRYPPNPCRDCRDRYVGCHSECERHAEWQRRVDAEREKMRVAYKKDAVMSSYKTTSIKRGKKYQKNNHRPGVSLTKFIDTECGIIDPNIDHESYD